MKRCPTCNRTYTDDALSFCLDDGALLANAPPPPNYDPNATLAYPAARDTSGAPTQVFPSQQPPQQVVPTPQPTPSWGPAPYAPPPVKKSKPLPWILGIVGVLLVLGIGAIVMLSIAGGSNSNNANANNNNRAANNSNNSNRTANANNANNKNANNSNNSNSATTTGNTLIDDFSTEKWATGASAFGSFYDDGEYHMRYTVAGNYVVIYAPDEDGYYTQDATVKVTARSVDGKSPDNGYGLVVHGELKDGKLEDYAFLIVNEEVGGYSVVQHQGSKEVVLVQPSRSSAIRTGTTPNELEVRVKGTQLSFYVNGQYITSVTDTTGYKTGRVGFYTSNGGEVAFDDLKIEKSADGGFTPQKKG
ncbi:MAG TPA: family 16 glycoside hydrolase [Pyrinomonadaceae bacterium]|jgi:hypothetical protein